MGGRATEDGRPYNDATCPFAHSDYRQIYKKKRAKKWADIIRPFSVFYTSILKHWQKFNQQCSQSTY